MGFERLAPAIQRWIWDQDWRELRDIQAQAIPAILDQRHDVVLAATTASGKTEAAFLPVLSALLDANIPQGTGFGAIYVGPLRALINDQFRRMEALCEVLGIPVVKWHSDAPMAAKRAALRTPSGILLTTPESLETMLIRRERGSGVLFSPTKFVVIDEVHSFLDTPRGRQLQSILHRIDQLRPNSPRMVRVGLSATLADLTVAGQYLHPQAPDRVCLLQSHADQTMELSVRGYFEAGQCGKVDPNQLGQTGSPASGADADICQHLFETLHKTRALVFAGSRARVESLVSGLQWIEQPEDGIGSFWAHHASLSRMHREDVEARMRQDQPGTTVATSSLELGLDVGDVAAVSQVGPPPSVSSLRQRAGRCGRRLGMPMRLRLYLKEPLYEDRRHPIDQLCPNSMQSIAMLHLMLARWNEPSDPYKLHLSTLIHQILMLICQHEGMLIQDLWRTLSPIFRTVPQQVFVALLRRMRDTGLIEQTQDGTLVLGAAGERLARLPDFTTAFMSQQEWQVWVAGGQMIGTIPMDMPLQPYQQILLGGRCWRVEALHAERHIVVVAPAIGGSPPRFMGSMPPLSKGVLDQMRALYQGDDALEYLNPAAKQIYQDAQAAFYRLELDQYSACSVQGDVILFPWAGPRAKTALLAALTQAGLEPTDLRLGIGIKVQHRSLIRPTLERLANTDCPRPETLSALLDGRETDKFDHLLGPDLMTLAYAHDHIDTQALPALAQSLLKKLPP